MREIFFERNLKANVRSRTCGETSGTSDARTIGYWQSASHQRSECDWSPGGILPRYLTHINYAFAVVGEDHRIAATNSFDPELYVHITSLKGFKPSFKVFISVRVMAAGGSLWSSMIESAASRATFIESAMSFVDTFAFDGIDIFLEDFSDGNHGADMGKMVAFMEELRDAVFGTKQISVAIPGSLCECWHHPNRLAPSDTFIAATVNEFPVSDMARNVDWFNLMSPGLDGTRTSDNDWKQGKVFAHSNLTGE